MTTIPAPMSSPPTTAARLRTTAYAAVAIAVLAISFALKVWVIGIVLVMVVLLLRAIRGNKAARVPEGSIPLRVIAFAAQAVGIIGLASTAEQVWGIAIVSLVILAVGHLCAYRFRHKPPLALRAVTFVMLHLVFVYMFYGLFHAFPYPQAQVAMLAMGVVSFELYSRLNLYSGMGIGMLNLYVAATLSRDVSFLAFLLVFVGILLAFLWRADSEDGVKDNPVILRAVVPANNTPRRRIGRRWRGIVLRFLPVLVLASVLVFIFTPHFAGHPLVPPFTITAPITRNPSAAIINPAVPLVQVVGSTTTGVSDYYYGFDSTLDLSYRGGLSDTLMMVVRSPAWSYWRSNAFDTYDGRTWTQSDSHLDVINSRAGVFVLSNENWLAEDYFVQTYQIVQPLPNLVFTAGRPIHVYIGATQLAKDRLGGLRVGDSLQPGNVYSVLSVRQDYTPAQLRTAGNSYTPLIVKADLQLPPTVTQETRVLAYNVTKDASTPYDKVIALRDYVHDHYIYDLYPPPQKPGADAVDEFLFDDKRGVCEQFVTSLVIMLRTLGIPARLTAGYSAGTYNPITGYYEVRANNAHAWAEVYFPHYGWLPFDPTPGSTADPVTGPIQRWIFSGAFDDIQLPSMSDMARTGSAIISTAVSVLGWPLLLLVVVLAAFGGRRLWKFIQQKGWNDRAQRYLRRDPARQQVFAAYRRAQRQLRSYRKPGQTVQEHAAEVPDLAGLADAVDVAAYRPQPPDAPTIDKARRWRKV